MYKILAFTALFVLISSIASNSYAQEELHGIRISAGPMFNIKTNTMTGRFAWFTQSYSSIWWDLGGEGLYNPDIASFGLSGTMAYTWDWLSIVPSFYLRLGIGEISSATVGTSMYINTNIGLVLEYLISRRMHVFLDIYENVIGYSGDNNDGSTSFYSLKGLVISGGLTWILGEEW